MIFLGDYLDPYGFENITVPEAIENFKEIIDFKKENGDKVVLLLGNHDMPYFSKKYFGLSFYHCRHSMIHHKEISKLFRENRELFSIAHVEGDIIFTHAGIESVWLSDYVKCDSDNINVICHTLNSLLTSDDGMKKLFMIGSSRGGRDRHASCIWADVHDMMWDVDGSSEDVDGSSDKPVHKFKQVFGHTLQAFYGKDGKIEYDDAEEFGKCKMLDTTNAYELDCENFAIEKIS